MQVIEKIGQLAVILPTLKRTEDLVVEFLQEDNICYRAMTGKKLLMDRSQFSHLKRIWILGWTWQMFAKFWRLLPYFFAGTSLPKLWGALIMLMMLRQCVVTTLCLSVMPYAKVMKNGKARRRDSARRARNSSWRWRRRWKKKWKVMTESTEAVPKSWPSQRGLGRLTSEVNWEQKMTLLVMLVSTCGQLAGCGFNALLFKPRWNDGFCRHVRRRLRSRTRPSQSLQPSPGTTDVWKELQPLFWNG